MSERISSQAIMERFDWLQRATEFRFTPEPLLVYKPNPKDPSKGTAMRINARVTFDYTTTDKGDKYRRANRQASGLFVDIVPQIGIDDSGNAKFDWASDGARVTAKLSMPDILNFLVAFREVRTKPNGKVPEAIRAMVRNPTAGAKPSYMPDPTGTVVGSVHKFNNETTILDWTFADRGSIFRIAKVREKAARSGYFTLGEEVAFVRYLENALDMFLEAGVR